MSCEIIYLTDDDYTGETLYEWDGRMMCLEHWKEHVIDCLKEDPGWFTEQLGLRTEEVE